MLTKLGAKAKVWALVLWECTFSGFIKCNPTVFHGHEGAVELSRWFENTEMVLGISECAEARKVKFGAATLQGRALTWWNLPMVLATMDKQLQIRSVKEFDITAYTKRFHELVQLCPEMVPSERKKIEAYIRGLTNNIKGTIIRSKPISLNEVVQMAHALMEPKSLSFFSPISSYKRTFEIGMKGPCGLLIRVNGLGIGLLDPDWLVDQDAVIVCGKKVVHIPIKNKTLVIEGDRGTSRLKIISCIKASKYIERGHQLFVAHVTKKEPKEKRLKDVPVIQDFPEVFPDDLPGLPPPWQVEFKIELVPGAAPVARAPYRLAPSEMKELADQLQELLEK
ncbi:hypothetical protein Tco_0019071 [Tanacetum coccineum]